MNLGRPLCVIDTETTGVDPANDRIVELAVVKVTPSGGRDVRCRRLNPGTPIPPEASAVHGITDADVADEQPFAAIAGSLLLLLEDCDLAGYNARRFDVPLLAAEFARCGFKWPAPSTVIVDAFDIWRAQEPMTLERAVSFYLHHDHEGAHGAEADALATLEVLEAQAARYTGSADAPLGEIAALMRDPDWLDETGKLKRVQGGPCINFGKHAGAPLASVDVGYLRWILGSDFGDDVKALCRAEIERRLT